MKNVFSYLDLVFFIVIVTLKLLVFGSQTATGYFSYINLILPILASVIILAAISCLFNKRKRAKLLYTFNLIITIMIISDLNYFRYFKDIISLPVLKNSFQLASVGSSVGSVFKFSDLIYAFDLVFVIPIIDHYKYEKGTEIKPMHRFALFMLFFIVSALVDTKCIYTLSKEQPRLITTMFNRIYVSNSLGSLNYHYLDLYNSLSTDISKHTPVSKKQEENIKKFFQNNVPQTTNMQGIAKGKNLIVIQVEALQQFVINKSVNGKEITPNLNKWLKRTMYFDNYYYQIASGGTSDAEFISNNSLYPAPSGAVYYLYSGNEYNSLPISLKEQGYTTAVMHGYRESFWNRNVMYPKLGFDNFFGERSYNINEKIGLGLSDKSFLSQSIDKLKSLNKPYYSFLITLSSHYPYDDVNNYGDFNVGSYEGTLLGNYLKSIHYTDAQLGTFLEQLDKEGITKDSVIVLYGDHYAIPKDKQDQLAGFLNKPSMTDLEWMEQQKVPLMIHFPDEKIKGVNNMYAGQMDLYPTLANLFGIHEDNLMGKDLFNSNDGKVIFRNGSFTDGKIFYISQTDTYYDISTGNKITETEDMKNKKENALNELGYSDDILKHDILKKISK